MSQRSRHIRISSELFDVRKMHHENLTKALNGLKISEVDVDRLLANKLRNVNIIDDFFKRLKKQ